MSYPIETSYIPGKTLYVVEHAAGGLVWNTNTQEFEAYAAANWVAYAIPLAEQSPTGYYYATYPIAIPPGTITTEFIYEQNGAGPVVADAPAIATSQSQGGPSLNNGGSGPGVHTWIMRESSLDNLATALSDLETLGYTIDFIMEPSEGATMVQIVAFK